MSHIFLWFLARKIRGKPTSPSNHHSITIKSPFIGFIFQHSHHWALVSHWRTIFIPSPVAQIGPATWRVLRRSVRGRTAAVWPGPRGSWGDRHGISLELWPFISYNWLFQWDYTFYKWGFLSTYNWYFGP